MTAIEVALLVATIGCVLANGFEVAAKAVGAQFVLSNCAEVGIDRKWIPYLAMIEGAGVAGLIVGLAGVRPLGLAAAMGLMAFFLVAVGVHLRTRVLHNLAFPLTFLALAVAAVTHFA